MAPVIIEALQATLVVPERILMACLVRPSTAAGVCPLLIPKSVGDRASETETEGES